jgi:hypothetical protein
MRRGQLEHIIRAAAAIVGEEDFVVIGSQAMLASVPAPPPEIVASVEVDLYPRDSPDRAIEIDGAIGDGSMFHDTHGYYAHGVGPETAIAPLGWTERLVAVSNENTRGATGWCMEPHDLVVAKLAAGRDRDVDYARAALQAGIVDESLLLERVEQLQVDAALREHVRNLLTLAIAEASR